jgi:hypothetical protein
MSDAIMPQPHVLAAAIILDPFSAELWLAEQALGRSAATLTFCVERRNTSSR